MVRLLLIIAIVAVGWYLFRRLGPGGPGRGTPPATGTDSAAGTQGAVTRCAQCGVHAPEGTGVRYQNLFFCSPEHLNDYLRQRGPQ